jgi:DNA polymerase
VANRDQQAAYLQAMGIQAWVPRGVSQEGAREEPLQDAVKQAAPARAAQLDAEVPVSSVHAANVQAAKAQLSRAAESEPLSAVSPAVNEVVDEEPPLPTDDHLPELDMPEFEPPEAERVSQRIDTSALDWPALQTAVSTCTACALHETRTQTVFGVGAHDAQWMIIGEAPGADEDQQGEPFVGRAGQLLNNMLRALDLQREEVFIANILKCRPPDNRDPRPEEIAQCEPFLQRQVALVAPKVILAVGGVAAHNLLKVDTPVSKLRGRVHYYGETPVVVTYHPAYLLRKPSEKAKSWQDLRFAATVVNGTLAGNAS